MNSDAEDYVARVLEENSLPVVNGEPSKWVAIHDGLDPAVARTISSGGPGSMFTVAWVLGVALGLIWVMRNGRTVFEQWQENVHRRANRRRHGIPDDDDRPFNVAYAAAALARRQREEEEKKLAGRVRREPPQPEQVSEWAKHGEAIGLRQRPLQPAGSRLPPFANGQPAFPQGSSTGNNGAQFTSEENSIHRVQHHAQQSTDPRMVRADHDRRRPHNPEDRTEPSQLHSRSSGVGRSRPPRLDVSGTEPVSAERRKYHELDESDDQDRSPKKSRVAVDEDVDGESDAVLLDMPGGPRRGSLQVPKRGAKRHANEEADDEWEMSQDKRARKGSSVHAPAVDDVVDVDMGHESGVDAELARGTKRDRDDAESVTDGAPNDPGASPRHARKRRVNRKEETAVQGEPSRGRKRDRSHERSGSSEQEDPNNAPTRHKKGRRLEAHEEDVEFVSEEASESEPEFSSDPACGGRRLGETWEVNGQSFKVGLDGRRLRHTLVRQSRTKFPMPKDSAHKDAKTNVDVIVEKWLNDDEYKAAKEGHELAWQDPSPTSTPEKPPVSAKQEEPPYSGGKRLLWGGPPPSPVKGRLSMHSPSIQNPFDLAPSNAGRRVASAQVPVSTIESPKLRTAKSFSKWEKQDLEASSLKKMRARMEKQKAEAAAAAAAKLPSPAPAPTPLTSTTNMQSQTSQVLPNIEPPKPLPSLGAQPGTPSTNPFAKQETNTPAGSAPGFSLSKPASTPSSGGALPSGAAGITSTLQTSNSSPAPAPATQPTPKPSFSFNVTPASGTIPSLPNKPVVQNAPLTLGTPGTVPSTSSIPSAKPTLSFGPSPSQETKSDAPKLSFNFNASTGSTPTAEPAGSGATNIFAKPGPQAPQASAPASTNSGPFSFNTTSQPAQGNSPAKSNFQFGQNNAPPSSGGTASLLSRLAPPEGSSQPPQPNQAQSPWSAPASGGQAMPSSSPFGKPNSIPSQPPSGNFFAQQGAQSRAQPSFSGFGQQGASKPVFGATATPASDTPKSSPFGASPSAAGGTQTNVFGQKPEQGQQSTSKLFGPGATSTSDTAKSSPFGASLSAAGATQSNVFGQKPEQQQQSTNKPLFAPGSTSTDAPKNNLFGASSSAGGSIFGQKTGQAQQSGSQTLFGPGAASASDTPKNNPFGTSSFAGGTPFVGFGQNPEQGQQNAAKSLFGPGATSTSDTPKSNPFGASSSALGVTSSAFSFTKPPGQADAPAPPVAPAFSFSAAQPNQANPPLSFNFIGQNTAGNSSQESSTNPSSAPSTGAAFSFGNTSTPSTQNPFGSSGSNAAESAKK